MIGLFDTRVSPEHDYTEEYRRGEGMMHTYRRMVSWEECPHLQTGDKLIERNNIMRKYGANSAFVKSMLFGRFQRSEDYNLIYNDDDLEFLKNAMLGSGGLCVGDDIQAAGDISGGGDEQYLMIREGTDILYQDEHQCTNELDQADYWVELLRSLGIPPWRFAVDGGGLGATVANYMETRLNYRGIKRCQANTNPIYKFEFRDKYTETHFFIKELLSAGVLRFKSYDKTLLKQARSRRYIEMEAGEKIKTEPKPAHRKREHSSPDRLDTLVYLFYDFDRYLLEGFLADGSNTKEDDPKPKRIKRWEEIAAEKSKSQKECFGKLQNMEVARRHIETSRRKMAQFRIGR